MRAPCTLTEAVLIVGLCLFAIGSARASVATHIAPMHQEKNACTRMEGNASSCPPLRQPGLHKLNRAPLIIDSGGPLRAGSSISASMGGGASLSGVG